MQLYKQELRKNTDVFNGEVAFRLYDTYGFPLDLTQDMLKDRGIKVDLDAYNKAMDRQKKSSKANWKGSGDSNIEGDFLPLLEKFGANEFVGYKHKEFKAKILAILDHNFKEIDTLSQKEEGSVMLDRTPFYATGGGQSGDVGVIGNNEAIATVKTTQKFHNLNLSHVEVKQQSIRKNDQVEALVIDREEVSKHHSATHLLQAALKSVLGDSIAQAGSYNDASRLRFDFTYSKQLTKEQLDKIETIVNDMILDNLENLTKELPINEAKNSGAIATFGEKYADIVRVVNFGDKSIEFCGGTHVDNTAQIGSFYIVKESGVSAGVRRIEAVVGYSAIEYIKTFRQTNEQLSSILKTKDLFLGVSRLKEQIAKLKKELKDASKQETKELDFEIINDTKVVVSKLEGGDIKMIIDDFKNANEKVAIMLIEQKSNKVIIACGAKGCNIKAGEWIKNIAPIVDGGGGGRDDFAQAGGKNTANIDKALSKSLLYLKQNL
jgi:alanyl-tRNA synthetase